MENENKINYDINIFEYTNCLSIAAKISTHEEAFDFVQVIKRELESKCIDKVNNKTGFCKVMIF
jgi:hypothetical protein